MADIYVMADVTIHKIFPNSSCLSHLSKMLQAKKQKSCQYKDLEIEVTKMWQMKTTVIPLDSLESVRMNLYQIFFEVSASQQPKDSLARNITYPEESSIYHLRNG